MNQYKIAEILHNATSAIPRPDGSVIVPWEALNDVLKDRAADTVDSLMNKMWQFPHGMSDDYCHLVWYNNMIDMGWTYGPTYSFEQKLHPSMVPFNELPDDEKIKDAIWSGIVYALYPYYTEETL
jgi:hypothetical protein